MKLEWDFDWLAISHFIIHVIIHVIIYADADWPAGLEPVLIHPTFR